MLKIPGHLLAIAIVGTITIGQAQAASCTRQDMRRFERLGKEVEFAVRRLENARIKNFCRATKPLTRAVRNADGWARQHPQCSQANSSARREFRKLHALAADYYRTVKKACGSL